MLEAGGVAVSVAIALLEPQLNGDAVVVALAVRVATLTDGDADVVGISLLLSADVGEDFGESENEEVAVLVGSRVCDPVGLDEGLGCTL